MATDLLEREQQAGNEADNLNVGQKDADLLFNKKNAPQAEINDDFDSILANNLDNKEKTKVDSHGDKVKSNFNADDEPDLTDAVKDKENAGGSTFRYAPSPDSKLGGFLGKLKGHAKNYGPSAGIVGLLIAGFGSASVILLPASLLVALEKAVTNDGSDSTRTNIVLRRAYMGSMLGKGDCSSKIKCKMTTMSEKQKTRWEKLGFKVESTEEGGRHKVASITSPDGKTKMKTGKEFNTWAESSLENRRVANRVVSLRAAYFQNAKFQSVLDKYKISKSKLLQTSTDKDKQKRTDAINKSFDENAESSPDEDTRKASVKTRTEEGKTKAGKLFKKGLGKSLSAVTAVGTACMAYNTTRLTVATVKAKWIYDLVKFAYPFIQAASQIEDQGNIQPEVVENLADRLTWYQKADTATTPEQKEKVNLTAMDSQGLQMAIYGDTTALKTFTQNYTTGVVTAAVMGSQITRAVEDMFGGKEKVRGTCQAAGAAGLASSVTCAAGPLALGACAAGLGILFFFGDEIIGSVVDLLAKDAIQLIASANLSSNLKGVDAGNALAAGVGLMLMTSSLGYGQRPSGSVTDINKFLTDTNDLNYKYGEELARYEARDTPLDPYNQYSFAGQIVSGLNTYRSNDNAFYGQFVNMFSVITSSFSRITPSAGALYYQPSNMTLKAGSAKNRTDKCTDPDMEGIGAKCDWSGRMVGYTTPEVIDEAGKQANGENNMIVDTIDYMLKPSSDGKAQIDDNGATIKGSIYDKYKTYCSDAREDPLGTSSHSVEEGSDDDQLWFTGEKCIGKEQKDQEMLNKFAIYFNYCESQVPTADEVENCWDVQAAPAQQAAQTCTGGWTFPVDKASTTFTSGFGARWGAQHQGIDLAGPVGTPVVAACAGTVSAAGSASGFGQWVVLDHDINGKKYSTVYGHIDTYGVAVGDNVSAGQQIATRGNQGRSTGPHLHFEIWDGGRFDGGTAIDPAPELGLGSPSE